MAYWKNDYVAKSLLETWDKTYVWHPFDTFKIDNNLLVTKASGDKLYLSDGRVIIDAISSWWVNLHGHAHPILNKALCKQSKQLPHVIFSGFTHEPAIRLAKALLETLPPNFNKVFYSDNGSTSTEVALKMAIQYWFNLNEKRTKIVAFENAYHGDTFGAMAVGGRTVFNKIFEPYLFEVDFIPTPQNDTELEKALNKLQKINLNQTAAFIYEPLVQGAAGMKCYPAKNLSIILQIFKKHEIICIADEVFTGFFRTGKFWASDYCEWYPDIICASKGLTGGYLPLGVTLCSQKISNAFQSDNELHIFMHGHTYTGNPLSCTLGLTSISLLHKKKTLDNISKIVQQNSEWANELKTKREDIDVNHLGTIFSIKKKNSFTHYFSDKRNEYYQKALNNGVLLRPIGNTIYTVPMYCTQNNTLNFIIETMVKIV